jgi:hypothetical protein
MRKNGFLFLLMAFAFVVSLTACSKPAATIGSLQIFEPWGRPADKGENSAAYMVIKNVGSTDDNLIKAESPAADMVEIHQTMMKDNVMSMSPVKGISVPSKGQAVLKPDSFHVMLMSLTKKLTPGDKISLDLTFEKAGRINVQAEIRKQ